MVVELTHFHSTVNELFANVCSQQLAKNFIGCVSECTDLQLFERRVQLFLHWLTALILINSTIVTMRMTIIIVEIVI